MSAIPNKILIIGPAWIGDMVMAQALFILLKQQNPQIIIDVLAPPWSLPLLARMPEVNQSIALPIAHKQLALLKRYKIGKNLRKENYAQAILLPNSIKSALIPFFARIPLRTGWRGEYRYGFLNDLRSLNKTKLPLMVQRFIALGLEKNKALPNILLQPKLQINSEQVTTAVKKFDLIPDSKPILALCPGAEFGAAKRWPEEHYAKVATQKLAGGWQVWLFGSANDQAVAEKINNLCQQQCIDLTGRTSLAEAIDLLSLVQQVVSNDSGLMHIAAALNLPLIVVYGSSSPDFTPPLTENKKIVRLGLSCSPCFKRECPLGHLNCLVQLEPEKVLDAWGSIR